MKKIRGQNVIDSELHQQDCIIQLVQVQHSQKLKDKMKQRLAETLHGYACGGN